MLTSFPDLVRADIREKWGRSQWPGDGTYFCEFVRCYLQHGFVYLDKPSEAIKFDRERLSQTVAEFLNRANGRNWGSNL